MHKLYGYTVVAVDDERKGKNDFFIKESPGSWQSGAGGARTLLCFNHQSRIIFLFGFKKNQLDNISIEAKRALKRPAKKFNPYNEEEVASAVQQGELFPIRE